MAGAVQTKAYKDLLKALVVARETADLSQADLARKIDKPPSFIGKYELGERRLDVIELFVVLKALKIDPIIFLQEAVTKVPARL